MSLTSFEVGQSNTAFIFFFSILIPSGSITTPKNPTFFIFYLHSCSFICKLFSTNSFTTFLDFICVQNSISGLVLYNGLNSIKFPWLFGFIWVKICGCLYLFLLPNYLLQTLQIYSKFIQSFILSKSKLLFSISLLKLTWRSVFITPFVILCI